MCIKSPKIQDIRPFNTEFFQYFRIIFRPKQFLIICQQYNIYPIVIYTNVID